jgi:hypothetical protein
MDSVNPIKKQAKFTNKKVHIANKYALKILRYLIGKEND